MSECCKETASVLENEALQIAVNAHGAELCRIYDKEKKREVLWDADPVYWGRFAPILFPMVGACYEKTYRYQGKAYQMGQHGFARDSEFEKIEASPEEIRYVLRGSKERENYPFSFALEVSHTLQGRCIGVAWQVTNTGEETLYYSIGGHPAFRVPQGCRMEDLSLAFGEDRAGQSLTFLRIEDPGSGCAYVDAPKKLLVDAQGCVAVKPGFWQEGVYIFENHQVPRVTLQEKGAPYVTLHCETFPYVGIWSKEQYPFVCLEPWFGRCDNIGFQGELSEKEGVLSLKPGMTQRFWYEIEIH